MAMFSVTWALSLCSELSWLQNALISSCNSARKFVYPSTIFKMIHLLIDVSLFDLLFSSEVNKLDLLWFY